MDDFALKKFQKRGASEKSTWLARGVSQKSMLCPQAGGGQKVLKIGPHGLWTTPYSCRKSCFLLFSQCGNDNGR